MRLFPIFLSVLFLAGCDRARVEDGIWEVQEGGDSKDGSTLLLMEEARNVETGELVVFATYGLPIRDGNRQSFLLWSDSRSNPFGLKPGDRFRFRNDLPEDAFSDDMQGFFVQPMHLERVGSG